MSTRENVIDELTAEAYRAHTASLQREVGQLRIVKEGLMARVKDLESQIEDMAYTIHVHERQLDEYAATVLTRDKRIAVLEAQLAEFETSFDRRTRRLRDLTLERLQRGA